MKVPIIITTPPPEFGELQSDPDFSDPNAMDSDLTYVPGFSELRLARDKAIVEVMQGKRRANEVPSLPMNFRWARFQNKKGESDNRKVIRAGNRGYRVVTKEMVGPGLTIPNLPAGAEFHTDGTIKQGDTILMVADAQRVARNEFQKRARTEAATKGAEAGFEAALESVGGRPTAGATPYIKKEVGQRVRAELAPKPKVEGK